MSEPISPSDIANYNAVKEPVDIVQVVNNLVAKKFKNGQAIVYTKRIGKQFGKFDWVNIVNAYRQTGWIVTFVQPFNFDSYFIFTEKG